MEFNIIQEESIYDGLSTPQAALGFPTVYGSEDATGTAFDSPDDSRLLLGVEGTGEPVEVDLDCDSPHILVSAGSGAGKSVIARSLATQALTKGCLVIILDIKRISHRWAKKLPGVHYASSAPEIGKALVSAGVEVHRRMEAIDSVPFEEPAPDVGPRVLIIYEEMNSTVDALKALDKQLPPRGVYKASDAFGDVMNLGRAAKVHVLGFAQYADAQTLPTRWRESFGFRVLIKHSSNAWNMLAWQCGYPPPAPQKPGRGFTVRGDKAIETQFLYLAENQAAELVKANHATRVEAGTWSEPTRRELRRQRREAYRVLARRTSAP